MIQRLFITFSLFLITFCAQAQTVKGRVLDGSNNNEPMIGATVHIPGTNKGVISDMDGNFTIDMPQGKVMLQVSMVGYTTKVVNVKGKTEVMITMQEDSKVMDEVVVIGYGTMKKRDLTGSMSQIKGSDLTASGGTDAAHDLQGKIAGVQVSQNDGAPGAGVSITVRGANSFSTSSQPLYVVDGIPYGTDPNGTPSADNSNMQTTSPLSMINPNDIEKIEVLKDASATAIYGSRGANGVVIITTKKGKKGEEGHPTIELNISWSMYKTAKRLNMLDAYTYALYQNEAQTNTNNDEGKSVQMPYPGKWQYTYIDGQEIHSGGTYKPSPEDFLNPGIRTDQYGNTSLVEGANWQNEIYQTGWGQDYSLSISDGNDKGWYKINGNYTDQTGIIKNTGFTRYGVSLNIGRHITKWLEVGSSSMFSHTTTDFQRTNSENTGIIRSALIFPTTYGPTASTEQLDELNWLATNPAQYVNNSKDQLKQISWFSSNYAEIKFTSWLKFRQNLGLGYNDGHRGSYYGRHTYEGRTPTNGKATKATNTWKSLTAESILTFDKKFGIHNINAMAGMTFEKGEGETSSMIATNFPNDYTQDNDMSLALDRPTITSSTTKQSLESFLARVNYTLLDKYMFTASMRTDGSSSFSSNNKWATFYSGAFAWRASDEQFIKNLNVFSNLKLRLSFGQTGNQAIGSYRTLTMLQAANYPYNGTLSSGAAMIDWRGPTNPNLKWETTNQFNAGIDFGFMGNRLQFTVDYYYKKTFDLLQNVTIPSSSGFSQMMKNSGNVVNQGMEFTLNYDAIRDKDWKWSVSANLSFNRNKIGGLDGDQFATSLWNGADQVYIQRNGCPIGSLYGYVEDGFYDNIAEVRSMKQYAALSDSEAKKMIGEIKYRDLNGDGYITAADRTIIGDTNPDFIYGFTSNLSWKNWEMNFMLQGSQGNDIFNYNLTDIQLANYGNITQEAYNGRWTEATAATATWPKAIAGYTRSWYVSDRFVENGSYLKMKYITLSYTFKKPFKVMQRIRLSFTVNNVFCITNYSWYDPDVNAGGSNAACPGVDSYSYPSSRSFILGANIVF